MASDAVFHSIARDFPMRFTREITFDPIYILNVLLIQNQAKQQFNFTCLPQETTQNNIETSPNTLETAQQSNNTLATAQQPIKTLQQLPCNQTKHSRNCLATSQNKITTAWQQTKTLQQLPLERSKKLQKLPRNQPEHCRNCLETNQRTLAIVSGLFQLVTPRLLLECFGWLLGCPWVLWWVDRQLLLF